MNLFLLIPFLVVPLSISIHFLLFWKSKNEKNTGDKSIENLLNKLEDIILSSITDFETVVQQISDAVAFELGFQVGVILVIDREKRVLRRVAVSRTEKVATAVNRIGFHFKGLETPLSAKNNITVQVATDGVPRTTKFVYDVLYPHVTREQAQYIQEVGELSSSLVYPIVAKGQTIGVMIFSLSNQEPELTEKRRILIERTLKMVGVALDNAMLYQELKVTSEQLQVANLRLKELDKLKDDFVSIASHELRTPMTAIRSYAWMALNRSDVPLTEKLKRYLSRTLISTERLINLVNDMLNISRIETGRIEILPKVFEVEDLVSEVLTEVEAKAKEKNQHLRLQKVVLPKVYADPDKVHQVLLNLIGNALKFTPVDGGVEVSFLADGQMVEVSVKDSGVGISKDDLSRLFRKFGRLDNSYVASATSGGTGLGLYISKSLVELMGGKIWASSEGLGKGTTFTFSLPAATNQTLSQAEKYTRRVAGGEAKLLESVAI